MRSRSRRSRPCEAIGCVFQALWDAAQTELRGARLEAQLADARLQALQAQINPHFLLNSLNAIASLVQVGERDRAFDAIGRLGELLRMALRSGRDLNVTLGDEINFLQSYLKLCKLRFESQFHYCVSMPESLRDRRVPALIVQPLIENSIRHGMVPPRALNVDVRIYAQNAGSSSKSRTTATASRETGIVLPAGHGLANVTERLRLCFGEAGILSLEPRAARRHARPHRHRLTVPAEGDAPLHIRGRRAVRDMKGCVPSRCRILA